MLTLFREFKPTKGLIMPPKVSVIVPIHNPGVYLKQCLDTILNQTLREIEVICVNDGSTDGSAYLLEEYTQKDDRIKVITQDCQGSGAARNKGLELATGEYLSFLDADDFFEDTMLEYMYYAAQKDQSDVVVCAHYVYDNRLKQDVNVVYPLQEAVNKSPLTQETAADFMFRIAYPIVWNKLFKRTFIEEHKILFASCPRGEDLFFSWQALMKAQKISVHPIPFAHYRLGTPFQSTSINGKPQTIILFLQMIKELYSKIPESPLTPKLKQSFVEALRSSLRHELEDRTGPEKKKSLKLIQNELPEEIVQKLFFNSARPSVSLILCVYNGEKYLVECLESLVHQTLQNIEIVCVDDASTDSSLKILTEYAEKDKRIKILKHPKNKKLSIARRTAMAEATGEYILYIDADDYLELDTCECLYFYSKIFDLDMCSFMSMEFLDQTREDFELLYHRLQWLSDRSSPTISMAQIKDIVHKVAVTSGLTLYKHDFLKENKIEWLNEEIFFEDTLFFTECLFRTQKFGALKETFLHKRTHNQCITQNRDKHFSDWCKIILYIIEIVKKYGNDENLNLYLDKYSKIGWGTYRNLSKELQDKYKQEMLNYCDAFVQKYHYPLPDGMQIWYDDSKSMTFEDHSLFIKTEKKSKENPSLLGTYIDFYNHLTDIKLIEKYYQNYSDHLKFELKNKLFSCTVQEKEDFLLNIPTKLPAEVIKKSFSVSDRPCVSIVVPVYNAEKYLAECLDSLIHQTLQNIEIICVNDGSTDSSLKILQEYAQKDNRIKILTQENQKQSIARRNAMKIARGEYIQYVDADDFIDSNTCECLYLYSKIHNLDMLLFAGTDFQDQTNEPMDIPYHHLMWLPENFIPVFSWKNIRETIHQTAVTACLTFYRHDFLKENHIEWLNESLWYEDTPFFTESILKAKRVGAFKKQFYHRRMHNNNTVSQMASNFPDFCKVVQKVIDVAKDCADEVALNHLFQGYTEKLYRNYQLLPQDSQIKFEQELFKTYDNLKDKYNLSFSDEIENWCYNEMMKNSNPFVFS